MTDGLIPRSKDRFSAVNCTTSMMKDIRTDRVKKVMVVYPRDSMMLQNINIQTDTMKRRQVQCSELRDKCDEGYEDRLSKESHGCRS